MANTYHDWVDTGTAVEATKRTDRTLRRWKAQRTITYGTRFCGQRLYDRHSFRHALDAATERQLSSRFDGSKPGPGRPRKYGDCEGQFSLDFDL